VNKLRVLYIDDNDLTVSGENDCWRWVFQNTFQATLDYEAILYSDTSSIPYDQQHDVYILDCSFDHTPILETLAAQRPDNLPAIVFFSGASLGEIEGYVQDTRDTTAFTRVSGIQKPASLDTVLTHVLRHTTQQRQTPPQRTVPSAQANTLDRQQVLKIFSQFTATPETIEEEFRAALIQFDPADMQRPYQPAVQVSAEACPLAQFPEATGSARTGCLAFTQDDIALLRACGERVVYVTSRGGVDTLKILPHVDAVIVLGDRASHFKGIAQKSGVAALMMEASLGTERGITITQSDNDSWLTIKSPDNTAAAHYKTGDTVTIDTATGRLYAGEQTITPAIQTPTDRRFADYLNAAAQTFRRQYQSVPFIGFSTQVDNPTEAQNRPAAMPIELSRSENWFDTAESHTLLVEAFLDPKNKKLTSAITEHVIAHWGNIFAHSVPPALTTRLFDFKINEFTPDEQQAIAARHSRTPNQLRGFTLAGLTPQVYRAIVSGIVTAASRTKYKEYGYAHPINLAFSIPCIETAKDAKRAKQTLQDVAMASYFPLAPVFETRAGIANAAEILRHCTANTIYVGSTDLATDHLGFSRRDDQAIQRYMAENNGNHPFLTVNGLTQDLTTLAQLAQEQSRSVVVCGEQATNFSFLQVLNQLDIHHVCIPCTPANTNGLPDAVAAWQVGDTLRRLKGAKLPSPTL